MLTQNPQMCKQKGSSSHVTGGGSLSATDNLVAQTHGMPKETESLLIKRDWATALECSLLCYEELLRMYFLWNICFFKIKKKI